MPSPKSNAYVRAWPCGSVEADASAVTDNGAVPLAGVMTRLAEGGWTGGGGGETTTEPLAVPVRPEVFRAVTVTVYVPEDW